MPWEITFINGTPDHRIPLGARENVIAALSAALPGLQLGREGPPPKELFNMMSPAIREALTQPGLVADFEQAGLSLHLSTIDTPSINWINAEIRGNGDPLPLLRSICSYTGWSVIDCRKQFVLNANKADASSWNRFCEWRDKAFSQAANDEESNK